MDHLDRLNEKLRHRERIFGYTAYIPSTYTLPEYKPEGVDYILFDCEHGPHDAEHYSSYYRHCRALGIPTVVRVADAVYHLVAHATDCGADGVLIPRVETMEQVRAAVEGLYLPPAGKKGYGGKFQFYPGETIEQYNRRRMLWIQIESPAGAAILPEILERYGDRISACVIGPCDLSINAGTPLDFYSDASLAVIRSVYEECAAHGISSGSYCFDEADAVKRIALGTNLIWMACDAIFLTRGIRDAAAAIAKL
ncbi:MAG: aldolase/citrate lyase family protein [Clostridiaceae bacterium]|nr:aldolase/citrate lyase family protein [Clostridiaceae bacterium]